jgi:hypothetical protein
MGDASRDTEQEYEERKDHKCLGEALGGTREVGQERSQEWKFPNEVEVSLGGAPRNGDQREEHRSIEKRCEGGQADTGCDVAPAQSHLPGGFTNRKFVKKV